MSTIHLLLIATAASIVVFTSVYLVARRVDNYGIVDVAWSYAFALIAAFYAVGGQGWGPRRALMAALVATWSLRLGSHIAARTHRHHPVEDGRYKKLRQAWRSHFDVKMVGFFLVQGVSVVVLGASFLVVAQNPTEDFQSLELAAAVLWLVALLGESVADAQLAAFKRTARTAGGVCDIGLWRFSRHPNYFFEWLIWVSFALFALASPHGWVGLIGPVGILWLLLGVTGIPMTEEQSIRSRGDTYRQYQRTTSAFVPWFRKQN